MDEATTNLAPIHSNVLMNASKNLPSLGQLEAALLAVFPAEDAEDWDKTGLLCGNPTSAISGVAVSLDASLEAIRLAAQLGANVLLTHHPAFLEAPGLLRPAGMGGPVSGNVVWEAIQNNVALMNFHTSLDVNPLAAVVLPNMLSLRLQEVLCPLEGTSNKGYGQRCCLQEGEEDLSLAQLAARATSVFGRVPRVWGNPGTSIRSVVTCTGSAGNLARVCVEQGVDCLICGEIKYHSALDASSNNLCIIELGHDASELPLCAVLAEAAFKCGVPEELIRILDLGNNWWTPEAVRK